MSYVCDVVMMNKKGRGKETRNEKKRMGNRRGRRNRGKERKEPESNIQDIQYEFV